MKRLHLFILCAFSLSAPAWAHKGSDAYLGVRQQDPALALQLSVALKDLDLLIPVDANADGRVDRGEARADRHLWAEFGQLDGNGDGGLDRAELADWIH